jgi:hypothetical protein
MYHFVITTERHFYPYLFNDNKNNELQVYRQYLDMARLKKIAKSAKLYPYCSLPVHKQLRELELIVVKYQKADNPLIELPQFNEEKNNPVLLPGHIVEIENDAEALQVKMVQDQLMKVDDTFVSEIYFNLDLTFVEKITKGALQTWNQYKQLKRLLPSPTRFDNFTKSLKNFNEYNNTGRDFIIDNIIYKQNDITELINSEIDNYYKMAYDNTGSLIDYMDSKLLFTI